MNEVIDAKIVRIVQIESCYDCPYCRSNNVGDWYCIELWNKHDQLSTDECLIAQDIIGQIWDKCPLPKAMCIETENKEDE